MNDYESLIVRLYQYLLAKDVLIKQDIINYENQFQKKKKTADDIFKYYLAMKRLEFWKEISDELWKLIQ